MWGGGSIRARPSRRCRRCRWSNPAPRTALGSEPREIGAGPAHRTTRNPVTSRPRRRMLSRAGLDVTALKCGAHWPIPPAIGAGAGARAGEQASALHNNCSGKHSGFLCAGLRDGGRPRQLCRGGASGAARGQSHARKPHRRGRSGRTAALDGCSVPTWAMPLDRLARGFARFATGEGLPPARATAAARLRAACAQQPWHVAGTGRFCTEIMRTFGERCSSRPAPKASMQRAARTGIGDRGEVRRRRRPRRRGHAGGGCRALSRFGCRSRRAGALRPADAAQLERH